jgi:hypothetical protein
MEEQQPLWDNSTLTTKVIELEKQLARLLMKKKVA